MTLNLTSAEQAQQAQRAQAREEHDAAVKASRVALAARRSANAQALIVAELEQDTSDSMSDYYGSKTVRTVALAWSTHKRDIFSELRKAAAKFEETRHLGPGCDLFTASVVLCDDVISGGSGYWKDSPSHWHRELYGDNSTYRQSAGPFATRAEVEAFVAAAPQPESIVFNGSTPEEKVVRFQWRISAKSVEHREKWSMGHGYYLAADGRYSGWQVRKVDVEPSTWMPIELTVLDAATPKPASANSPAVESVTVSFNEEKSGVEIRFPSKPAGSVLEDLKAHGWRWSRFSSCWYHRDSPEARAYAQALHASTDPHCSCNDCMAVIDGGDDKTPPPSGPVTINDVIDVIEHGIADVESIGEDGRGDTATSAKLRELASGMDEAIESKMNPGVSRQNLTARRARIADGMRKDGERLQMVQKVLRKLADAHADPRLWPDLEAIWPEARQIRSKAAIERLSTEGRTWVGGQNAYTPSVLDRLSGGKPTETADAKVRRLERDLIGMKIPGFFPTPHALGIEVIEAAAIEPDMSVLEPSAGKGDLAELARAAGGEVTCVERSDSLRAIIEARGLTVLETRDILTLTEPTFDRIVMNPPFEHGQDMEHVQHCFDHLLTAGGRLVSVVSEAVFFRDDRKFEEFRSWMADYLTNDPEKVQRGFTGAQAFRQTGVATRIIVLDKPAACAAPKVVSEAVARGEQKFGGDETTLIPAAVSLDRLF